MSEAENGIWIAIHHYESALKNNPKADYVRKALKQLKIALDEVKKYEDLKEKYFK